MQRMPFGMTKLSPAFISGLAVVLDHDHLAFENDHEFIDGIFIQRPRLAAASQMPAVRPMGLVIDPTVAALLRSPRIFRVSGKSGHCLHFGIGVESG